MKGRGCGCKAKEKRRPGGGPAGDCYCFIHVKEHSLFQREGQHLICQVPITYSQAALGAKIEVPTLEGREELSIPPGTQSGEIFRLRGRGHADAGPARQWETWSCRWPWKSPRRSPRGRRSCCGSWQKWSDANVSPHRKSFFEKLKDYFIPEENTEGAEEQKRG